MGSVQANGEVVLGDVPYDGRVILYILKADETNYINYIKPLILAEELQFPHLLSIIDTKDQWFYEVHPERYVPALKDQDPVTKEKIIVFEGTACLQYLADRFDTKGDWTGRTARERADVFSWTAYQTAGIGDIRVAKILNSYQRQSQKLHSNTVKQWDILEKRLSLPGQDYIALADRPTIADISYFPFAMPWMFKFLDVDIANYPKIKAWGDRIMTRPAFKTIMERGPKYGHDE